MKAPGISTIDTEAFLRRNTEVPLLYVRLPTRPDTPQRWFFADTRNYESSIGLWTCVHGATVSPTNLMRNIQWGTRNGRDKPWAGYYVIEADNKTQAAKWLRARGINTCMQFNNHKYHDINAEAEVFINMAKIDNPDFDYEDWSDPDITALQRTIERAQAKIDFIASLPDEPAVDEDGVAIIYFKKTFNPNSRIYDYAAIKAGDGKWYTTGPASPKGYTWKQLVKWIFDGSPNTEILTATEWEAL